MRSSKASTGASRRMLEPELVCEFGLCAENHRGLPRGDDTVCPHRSLGCRIPAEFVVEIGGEKGYGNGAAWEGPKAILPTPLGNSAEGAGFPLSHSHGDGGPIRHVAREIRDKTPSATLKLDRKRGRSRQAAPFITPSLAPSQWQQAATLSMRNARAPVLTAREEPSSIHGTNGMRPAGQ
jgi:hypothetical protein